MKSENQVIRVAVFGDDSSKLLVSSYLSKFTGMFQLANAENSDVVVFHLDSNELEQSLLTFQANNPNTPTIVVAGKAVNAECSAFIKKPYSASKLLNAIESILKKDMSITADQVINDGNNQHLNLYVAVMAHDEHRREALKKSISEQGIQVVLVLNLLEEALQEIQVDTLDALVVELTDDEDVDADFIFDYNELPVIFSDQDTLTASGIAEWSSKLINKSQVENDSVSHIHSVSQESTASRFVSLTQQSTKPSKPSVRVVIMTEDKKTGQLKQLLEQHDIRVVAEIKVSEDSINLINIDEIDLILADLSDEMDDIDFIFEYDKAPVVFCDHELLTANGCLPEEWISKLKAIRDIGDEYEPTSIEEAVEKIPEEVNSVISDVSDDLLTVINSEFSEAIRIAEEKLLDDEQDLVLTKIMPEENRPVLLDIVDTPWKETPSQEPGMESSDEGFITWSEFERNEELEEDTGPIRQIWVLAASIGGPPVVKRFLQVIPADIAASFVLAQHIGENFVSVMADRLDSAVALNVRTAVDDDEMMRGNVLVVPAGKKFNLDKIGKVKLTDIDNPNDFTPNIDHVIDQVLSLYSSLTNIIVFSGMGKDGIQGAEKIAKFGGKVWSLDLESCVASNMPEAANKLGIVSFSGTPEKLAEELSKQIIE